MYRKVFETREYIMLEEKETITIVEKGEIIPRTGVIKEVLYVRSEFFYNFGDSSYYFIVG